MVMGGCRGLRENISMIVPFIAKNQIGNLGHTTANLMITGSDLAMLAKFF